MGGLISSVCFESRDFSWLRGLTPCAKGLKGVLELASGDGETWGHQAQGRAVARRMGDVRRVIRIGMYIIVEERRVENTVCYDVWMEGLGGGRFS
jgi:hypothetical protein